MGDAKIYANPPLDAAVALLQAAGLPAVDLTGAEPVMVMRGVEGAEAIPTESLPPASS